MRASIYVRISDDQTGEGAGVERQEQACRELCKRNGWTVGELFADNDISATSGKRRPEFERLLKSEPESIVVWSMDRLLRTARDLERVIELGVNVHAVNAGNIDLSTPSGRAFARSITAFSQMEGEVKAERQKLAHEQRVNSGRTWWAWRPAGYEQDGTLRPWEAELVRQAYSDVLNGGTLAAVARRWNDAGMLTTKGNAWSGTTVQQLLRKPRNAGIIAHNGEERGRGSWESIVPEELYRAVVSKLDAPGRPGRNSGGGHGRREHMLTGLARCGRCGDTVRVYYRGRKDENGERLYGCRRGQCVTHPADWVDSIVLREVIDHVDSWGDLLDSPEVDEAEVKVLREEEATLITNRDALGAALADPDSGLDLGGYQSAVAALNSRLEVVRGELAKAGEAYGSLDLDTEYLWQELDAMDVDRQRVVIERACESITLTPTGRGRKRTRDHVVVKLRKGRESDEVRSA